MNKFKTSKILWLSAKPLNKATQEEKDLEKSQAAFYTTMQQDYAQQFGAQSAITKSLSTAFEPILQAGQGQYGYTPAEDTALRTGSSDSFAQANKNAQLALGDQLASEGGGNMFLPSGAAQQLKAQLLTSNSEAAATDQNNITTAGYQQGNVNFQNAAAALSGNAQILNPAAFSSSANTAGSNASDSAQAIQKANDSWMGILGGALGGVSSVAGAAIGKKL
jgi:hypothetical protein